MPCCNSTNVICHYMPKLTIIAQLRNVLQVIWAQLLRRQSQSQWKQKLSYRKQITSQLCTQFVEGIYVTLKFRLRINQGHWKRNHWIDHTRLTISTVIWRWILSWPRHVGQRSLKVIEIGAIRKLGCGFLFAFYSNYGRICSRLWDI